ncbi:MAG: 50S ribosomal protein L17 [Thermodesulfobacteriota bacterium]
MRHQKAGAKLGRTSSHREAMFRNMVTSLFKHQRIRTTDAKAKAIRSWADHVITLAKRGDLHARRQVLSIIREKAVAHKLFEEASERFGGISGGYTRVVKIGRRPGDAAPISLVELVSTTGTQPKKAAPKPTVTATPTPTPSETVPTAAETQAPAEETAASEETAPTEEAAAAETEESAAEASAETEAAQPEAEERPVSEKNEDETPEETDTRKTE